MGKNNHFSWSQISTYRQCPKKWQLSRDWEPLEKSVPLVMGSLIHEALGFFYSHTPEERNWHILEAKINQGIDQADCDTIDNCLDMMQRYWLKYREDADIIPVEVEHQHHTDSYKIVFIPDMVVQYNGLWWIWETKTGKPDILALAMDDPQTRFYAYLHPDRDQIGGAVYQTVPARGEPQREWIFFAHGECRTYWDSCWRTMNRMLRSEHEMNPGHHCKWCEFAEPCRMTRYGIDTQRIMEENYRRVV